MITEKILSFLENNKSGKDQYVKIDFKNRSSVYAHFITESNDFKDLCSKNFWRVVPEKHFEDYNKSKSLNFARIFHGSDFTKLSMLNVEVKS